MHGDSDGCHNGKYSFVKKKKKQYNSYNQCCKT